MPVDRATQNQPVKQQINMICHSDARVRDIRQIWCLSSSLLSDGRRDGFLGSFRFKKFAEHDPHTTNHQ